MKYFKYSRNYKIFFSQKYWIVYGIFGVLVFFFLGGLSFAKENSCIVCATTPDPMQHYINRAQQVLETIKTTKHTEQGPVYESPRGLFTQGGLQAIPDETTPEGKKTIYGALFAGLRKNIQSKLQGFMVTTLIMSHMVWNNNLAIGFLIMFQPSPYVRDYKKLIELDSIISDRMYELGLAGAYYDKIHPDHAAKIHEISKQYQSSGDIFGTGGFLLGPNATYGQLLRVLWTLNQDHKEFLGLKFPFSSTYFTNQFGKEKLKKITKGDITIIFGERYQENLSEMYACAKMLTCEESFEKFGQNMKNVWKAFANGFGESVKTMKSAAQRLQIAITQRLIVPKTKLTSQICKKGSDTLGDYWMYVDKDTKNTIYFRYIPAQFNNATKTKIPAHWTRCEETETDAGKCSDPANQGTVVKEDTVITACQFRTRDMGVDKESQEAIQEYLTRERDLLKSQYGLRAKDGGDGSIRLRLRSDEGWSKSLEKRREKRIDYKVEREYKKQARMLEDIQEQQAKALQEEQKKIAEEKRRILEDIRGKDYIIFADAKQLQNLEAYKNTLTNAITDVIQQHVNALDVQVGADITDITKALGSMVTKIRYATNMIKDKNNPRSLVNNLGKACEGQCSNAGGKCRSE